MTGMTRADYGCVGMTGMTKDIWGLLGMSRDDLGDYITRDDWDD